MKKRILLLFLALLMLSLPGCVPNRPQAQVAATTMPVYEFTSKLLRGSDISVVLLVTQSVSCLHDYAMTVDQARTIESAQVIVLSGGGLEDFLRIPDGKTVIDSSVGMTYLDCDGHDHKHDHGHDPHFWLSPACARIMVRNIHNGLQAQYPQLQELLRENLDQLLKELDALERYGKEQLANLSCRELITFHDGFGYFAEAFGLTILKAIEEESGSEASAGELKELITLVRDRQLSAIFTERNGSTRGANIIAAETNATVFTLDMAMSGAGYFEIMYQNIDTIKEALE